MVANGPIWSSELRERDEPVARHQRRRWASRRRRRRAPRAGGSSRRCRSRAPSGAYPAATAAAEPPLEPPGHARRVARVAGGPERRVLGGRAHRELVEVGLADGTAPAPTQPLDDGRVVRRAPALEDPRRAGGGDATRAEVVLERDRHAGERARDRRPRRPRRRPRPRPRAPLVGDEVEGVELGFARGDRRRGAPRRRRRADRSPAAHRRRRARSAATLTARRGCAERGTGRLRPPGAIASTSSRSRLGRTLVGAQHVDERERVRGGRHVVRCRAPRPAPRARGSRRARAVNCSISSSVSASRASRATCSTSARVSWDMAPSLGIATMPRACIPLPVRRMARRGPSHRRRAGHGSARRARTSR